MTSGRAGPCEAPVRPAACLPPACRRLAALSACMALAGLMVTACGPDAGSAAVHASTTPRSTLALPPAVTLPPTAAPTEPSPAPRPERLTTGGCCTFLYWLPDSRRVAYLDRPDPGQPAGVYAVSVEGGAPVRIGARPQIESPDGALAAEVEGGRTIVTRLADGMRWMVPDQGRPIRFSPSGRTLAWQVSGEGIAFPEQRQRSIWLATPEGKSARRVVTVIGGGLVGWAAGETAIIVTGRLRGDGQAGVWRVPLGTGEPRLLRAVEKVAAPLLSPDGAWLAYYVAFSGDPGVDGLWLLRTDDGHALKVSAFGAYRWRSPTALLLIPLGDGTGGAALWQVEPETGQARQLTDPQATPLPVANNDWLPSPDGKWLVFVSSEDDNLWVLDLP